MSATGMNYLDVVKYLVTKGADVNAMSKDDITPLMDAASKGNLEVVEFLVAKDADVNARMTDGSTPLMMAAGKQKVVEFLKQHGAKE